MKLPVSIAAMFLQMQGGHKIPLSKVSHPFVTPMFENGILQKQIFGRRQVLVYVTDSSRLNAYLKNHFGIESLESYAEGLRRTDLTRAEAVAIASTSKLKAIRTFKGFLVNSFHSVDCLLNGEPIIIRPYDGTFTFIYDFENFIPNDNITIVGIENPENFRHVSKQKNLFDNIRPLFVSRYPQTKDLVRWLQIISNPYLHFGDFDFAGLNIYMNEFKKHLHDKASFYLPPDIELLLSNNGNRDNYDNQTIQFDRNAVEEENVLTLLRLIEQYKKGLEQEIYAK